MTSVIAHNETPCNTFVVNFFFSSSLIKTCRHFHEFTKPRPSVAEILLLWYLCQKAIQFCCAKYTYRMFVWQFCDLLLPVGQWSAGPSFNQEVGRSIPALFDVSLSKTLDPELLHVAVSMLYDCHMIISVSVKKVEGGHQGSYTCWPMDSHDFNLVKSEWTRTGKRRGKEREAFALKVRSHQKRNYFFSRPNPMKGQRTDARGCDRRDIFPGGAFGATRCGRRVFSGTIFAPSSALVALEAEVFQT